MTPPKTSQQKPKEGQNFKTSILVRRQAIVRFIFSLKKQIGWHVRCIKVLAEAAQEASSIQNDQNPLLRKSQLLNKMEQINSRAPCYQQHQGLMLSFGTNINAIVSYLDDAHQDQEAFHYNLGVICQIIDKDNADASQRENREQLNIMRKEIIDQRIKEKEHNHQKNEIISEVMERIASTNAAGTQITMSASANLQKTLEEPLMLTLLFLIALLGICHLLKSLQQNIIPPPTWLLPVCEILFLVFGALATVMMGIIHVRWLMRQLKSLFRGKINVTSFKIGIIIPFLFAPRRAQQVAAFAFCTLILTTYFVSVAIAYQMQYPTFSLICWFLGFINCFLLATSTISYGARRLNMNE